METDKTHMQLQKTTVRFSQEDVMLSMSIHRQNKKMAKDNNESTTTIIIRDWKFMNFFMGTHTITVQMSIVQMNTMNVP